MSLKNPKILNRNKKKKIVRNKEERVQHEENLSYKLLHINLYALKEILKEAKLYDLYIILSLGTVLKRNSNIILNRMGEPAQSRDEIISALNLTSGTAPNRSLTRLLRLEVISRVKSDDLCSYYTYCVNPHVMYYGLTVLDTTYEIFQDSRWNFERCV